METRRHSLPFTTHRHIEFPAVNNMSSYNVDPSSLVSTARYGRYSNNDVISQLTVPFASPEASRGPRRLSADGAASRPWDIRASSSQAPLLSQSPQSIEYVLSFQLGSQTNLNPSSAWVASPRMLSQSLPAQPTFESEFTGPNDFVFPAMQDTSASYAAASPSQLSIPPMSSSPYYTLIHPSKNSPSPLPSESSPHWIFDGYEYSPSPSPIADMPRPEQDIFLSPPVKDEVFSPRQVPLSMFPEDYLVRPQEVVESDICFLANAPSPSAAFMPSSFNTVPSISQPPSLENSPMQMFSELPEEPIQVITRKSRGRRVPNVYQVFGSFAKAAAVIAAGGSKAPNARNAVCFIPGCGGCFLRNEHLKRHLISIHSQDKPWYCPYQNCKKNFNRQDNLAQHMRTHTDHGEEYLPVPPYPYNCPYPDVVEEVRKASKPKKPRGLKAAAKNEEA